jgi:hypothetical protein
MVGPFDALNRIPPDEYEAAVKASDHEGYYLVPAALANQGNGKQLMRLTQPTHRRRESRIRCQISWKPPFAPVAVRSDNWEADELLVVDQLIRQT